jgi:hypothetical protein
MPINLDAVTLALLALCAVLIIGILVFVLSRQLAERRRQRNIKAIRAVIVDYFRRSGVPVTVDCAALGSRGLYTAMVESEPMKRFRLSHIIEMTMREHVRKTCNLELDRIYWRFPVKEAAPNQAATGAAEAVKKESPDEYINEGLENYRHIPKPEVTELPWETFEQMSGGGEKKE